MNHLLHVILQLTAFHTERTTREIQLLNTTCQTGAGCWLQLLEGRLQGRNKVICYILSGVSVQSTSVSSLVWKQTAESSFPAKP